MLFVTFLKACFCHELSFIHSEIQWLHFFFLLTGSSGAYDLFYDFDGVTRVCTSLPEFDMRKDIFTVSSMEFGVLTRQTIINGAKHNATINSVCVCVMKWHINRQNTSALLISFLGSLCCGRGWKFVPASLVSFNSFSLGNHLLYIEMLFAFMVFSKTNILHR